MISTSLKETEPQKIQGRISSEKAGKATSTCGPRKGCVGLDSNLNPYKRSGKPETQYWRPILECNGEES